MKMKDVFTGGKVVEIGGYHDNDAYINTEHHGFGTDEEGVTEAAIHAINMHDELVEALKLMVQQFGHEPINELEDQAIYQARLALTKSELGK